MGHLITTSYQSPVASLQFHCGFSRETELGTGNWKLLFRRQDDPYIRARIPGAALVVTQHGQHSESRPLEPSGQLRHRQGSEGQGKPEHPALTSPLRAILLIEDGQPACAILTDGLDQRERGVATLTSREARSISILFPLRQIGDHVDGKQSTAPENPRDRGKRPGQIPFVSERLKDAV